MGNGFVNYEILAALNVVGNWVVCGNYDLIRCCDFDFAVCRKRSTKKEVKNKKSFVELIDFRQFLIFDNMS